jgi:TRAP-type C4-dicarboxylate transport system permease small subunit
VGAENSTTEGPADRIGRALHRLCGGFALFGGLALVLIMLLSVASIIGRGLFLAPIQGDFELVQIGCAVAVFAFMPWCQLRGGHIVVDFFTTKSSPALRGRLDAISSTLLGLLAALIAWRLVFGALDLYDYDETTMVLRIPSWLGYVPATLSAALLSVVSFYTAWRSLAGTRR